MKGIVLFSVISRISEFGNQHHPPPPFEVNKSKCQTKILQIRMLPEEEEAIHAKFRAERKTLQGQITAMKKSSASDKKKKKQVLESIAQMEAQLEDRYQKELAQIREKQVKETTASLESKQVKEECIIPSTTTSTTTTSTTTSSSGIGKSKQQRRKERKAAELDRIRKEAESEEPLIDRAKIELEKLAPKLAKLNMVIHNIVADGHCLFNAISHQLKIRMDKVVTCKELRSLAVKHIRANKEEFLPFLLSFFEENGGGSLDEYCDRMENEAVWGGQPEIKALANELNVSIHVIQVDAPDLVMSPSIVSSSDDDKTLYISYHKHQYGLGEHYNSLETTL